MSNLKKILDSFQLKETLNPKVWKNPEDPKKSVMIPKVKNALEKISEDFIDYLGEDVFVQDVILTGSLANYNWSEFSDFDLHVVVDFEEYGDNQKLYKELFDLKKFIFNNNHDIKIYGYDVELYAQDEKETHYASGVYSIMNDEWLKTPKKEKFDLDKKVLKDKIKCWVDKIEKAINTSTLEDDKEILDKVKDKLKEYRKSGLEKNGELSYENLVFKFLRRSGHIEKLFDLRNKVKDRELSVERKIQESTEGTKNADAEIGKSPFLKKLHNLFKDKFSVEATPNQKEPYEPEVEQIQQGLQLLNFLLPKYGIDGKFGTETQQATKDFQKSVGLGQSGVWGPEETVYLIAKLILNGFSDSKLSSLNLKGDSYKPTPVSTNFKDVTQLIIDKLEGGYYHPDMKKRNPQRFAAMLDSGETMFGMDRKHGHKLETDTPQGQEFWSLIDAENASENWEYEYMLDDNPTLKNKLMDLVSQIMEPLFMKLSQKYLSAESIEAMNQNPELYFNFAYATWNGSGWFQRMSNYLNKEVETGKSPEELGKLLTNWRMNNSHFLLRRTGKKIQQLFGP